LEEESLAVVERDATTILAARTALKVDLLNLAEVHTVARIDIKELTLAHDQRRSSVHVDPQAFSIVHQSGESHVVV